MLMKIEGAIKNGQRHWQHWAHMTQDKDKQQQDICWTPLCVSKDK